MSLLEIKNEQEYEKICKEKFAILDFFATWCGPCKHLTPELADLAKNLPLVKFRKVNVQKMAFISNEFNVKTLPTVILLNKGKEVNRVEGNDIEAIMDMILQNLN